MSECDPCGRPPCKVNFIPVNTTSWKPIELQSDCSKTIDYHVQQTQQGFSFPCSAALTDVQDFSLNYDAFTTVSRQISLGDNILSSPKDFTQDGVVGTYVTRLQFGQKYVTAAVGDAAMETQRPLGQLMRLEFQDGKVKVLGQAPAQLLTSQPPRKLSPDCISLVSAPSVPEVNSSIAFVPQNCDQLTPDVFPETSQPADLCLTVSLDGQVYFATPSINESVSQLFQFQVCKNSIALSTCFPNQCEQLSIQPSKSQPGKLEAAPVSCCGPTQFTITVDVTNLDADLGPKFQSSWVTYDTCSTSGTHGQFDRVEEFKGNVLMTFPLETAACDKAIKPHLMYLKNHQAGPGYTFEPSSRTYDRLLFGHNERIGFDNPSVSYTGRHTIMEFAPDTCTYFHYPWNAVSESIAVSATNLAVSGALAGSTPASSDTLAKYQYGYGCYTSYGSPCIGEKDGTWLCTWLKTNDLCGANSGKDLDQQQCQQFNGTWDEQNQQCIMPAASQWMDRYYDENISVTHAVSAYDDPNIVDVPSQLVMEQGVLYRYCRQGVTTVNRLLEEVDNRLQLHIEQWGSPIVDKSLNDNTIIGYGIDPNLVNSLELPEGNGAVVVTSTPQLQQSTKLSMGGWLYKDNWLTTVGNGVFGNYYQGGIGVSVSTGVSTPQILTIGDCNQGVALGYNINGQRISQALLPTDEHYTRVDRVFLDRGNTRWFVDSENASITIVDTNDNITNVINLPQEMQLVAADLSPNDTLYILDQTTMNVLEYARNGKLMQVLQAPPGTNEIIVSKEGQVIYEATSPNIPPQLDSKGNVWTIRGYNLYKSNRYSQDGEIKYTTAQQTLHAGTNVTSMVIDYDDKIWLARNGNKITVFDKFGDVVIDQSLPPGVFSDNLQLTLTREFDQQQLVDYIWVLIPNQQRLFKYNSSGSLNKCFTIDPVHYNNDNIGDYNTGAGLCMVGDPTGYFSRRKFDVPVNSQIALTCRVALTEQCDGIPETVVNLKHSIDPSIAGWRHVFVTVDLEIGEIILYVDGTQADKAIVAPRKYSVAYPTDAPFVIGADAGLTTSLARETNTEFSNQGFNGKIDDVRYYDITLNPSQVRAIAWQKTLVFDRVNWPIEIPPTPQVETFNKFYKGSVPPSKSNIYDIAVRGLQIDEALQEIIARGIRKAITKVSPAYTTLRNITWS